MIKISAPNFYKSKKYLTKMQQLELLSIAHKYGKEGVSLLQAATPILSGATANSWYYTVTGTKNIQISYYNSNINNGVNIALIIQLGHGTGTGGWVEGIDYINPVIKKITNNFIQDLTRKVVNS